MRGKTLSSLVLLALLGCTGTARAGLIHQINVDTPLQLDVQWGWTPESDDSSLLSAPDLLNWTVLLETLDDGGGEWLFKLRASHAASPHLTDGGPGGQFQTSTEFEDDDYGWLVNANLVAGHGAHQDAATVTFWRDLNSANNLIRLTASHPDVAPPVPEPGSLALLGMGLLGLWKRRRAAR